MIDILYYLFVFPIEFIMKFLLEFFYSETNSYGLSIIALSLVVNILVLPLYYFSDKLKTADKKLYSGMEREIKNIKKHYHGQERHFYIQAIYRRFGYHPFSSVKASLSFLIQIPFFIAAFHLLSEYRAFENVSFLILNDLGQADGLLGGVNVLPILMTAINLLSAYIYASNFDKSEKIQLWVLSFIFLVVLYQESAALLLYWTLNNLFSLGKNWIESSFAGQNKPLVISKLNALNSLLFKQFKVREEGRLITLNFSFFRENRSFPIEKVISKPNSIIFLILIMAFSAMAFFLTGDGDFIYPITVCLVLLSYSSFVVFFERKQNLELYTLRLCFLFLVYFVLFVLALDSFSNMNFFGSYEPGLICGLLITTIFICNFSRDNKFDRVFVEYIYFSLVVALFLFLFNPAYLFFSSPVTFGTDPVELFADSAIKNILIFMFYSLILYVSLFKLRHLFSQAAAVFVLIIYLYGYVFTLDLGIYRAGGFANEKILVHFSVFSTAIELLVLIVILAGVHLFYKRVVKVLFIFSFAVVLLHAFDVRGFIREYYIHDYVEGSVAQKENLAGTEKAAEIKFSKDKKNVLIIVMDAFPAWQLDAIFEKKPELRQKLEDFIWYKNTVSNGTYSMVSTPGLVAGNQYTMDKINQKEYDSLYTAMEEAWRYIPENFNGFDVQYLDANYLSLEARKRIEGLGVEFLTSHHIRDTLGEFSDRASYIDREYLIKAAVFKSLPITLKKLAYNNDFLTQSINTAERYISAKAAFFALKKGINGSSSRPTIKFLWLNGMIRPLYLTEECNYPSQVNFDVNGEEEMEGVIECHLNVLEAMFSKMKRDGYYDNTKIILTSDHGSYKYGSMWHEYSIYAFLSVKDFDAKGEFTVSNTPMMNSDVIAIACSSMSICFDAESDPRENEGVERVRRFNVTTHGNANSLKEKTLPIDYHVEVEGDVYNKGNWKRVYP